MADGFAPIEAQSARHIDFADYAILQHPHCLDFVCDAAALRSDLDHALVFARGCHHLPAFVGVVARRFFDINIFARLTGPYGCQRVPVVRQRQRHGVDFFVSEDIAHIFRRFRLLSREALHKRHTALEIRLIHIAQRIDVRVRLLRVLAD